MRNETIQLNVWHSQQKREAGLPGLLFKAFYMVLGLLTALLVAYFVSVNHFSMIAIMPIKYIEIKNELSNQRAVMINDVLADLHGQSFLGVDLGEVQKYIETIPWVESATLGRQWPDKVYVDIKESIPVAVWQGKSVSLSGKIFQSEDKEMTLPVFLVSENMLMAAMEAYIQLQNDFADMNLYIQKIKIDDRGSISLLLDNNTTLILGSNNILTKNSRAKKIMSIHDTGNKTIDMRYENGFAISETN